MRPFLPNQGLGVEARLRAIEQFLGTISGTGEAEEHSSTSPAGGGSSGSGSGGGGGGPIYITPADLPPMDHDDLYHITADQHHPQVHGQADHSGTGSPQDIGATTGAGSGTMPASIDHTHKGVRSLAKSGGTQLFNNVTLSEGPGIALTVSGNDIEIEATGAGGGQNEILIGVWYTPFDLLSIPTGVDQEMVSAFRPGHVPGFPEAVPFAGNLTRLVVTFEGDPGGFAGTDIVEFKVYINGVDSAHSVTSDDVVGLGLWRNDVGPAVVAGDTLTVFAQRTGSPNATYATIRVYATPS